MLKYVYTKREGPSYWKLNTSMLNEDSYREIVNTFFKLTVN